MRRLWLAFLLVLSVGFAVPSVALADDGMIDSFTGGLQTLVSPESVKVEETDSTPESVYLDSYEPVLREVEPAELGDEATTMDSLISVITACNRVQAFSNQRFSLLDSIVRLCTLSYANGWLVAAVGIVFMWWGVRKVIRIIKAAWYKGHASV